MVTLYFNLTNLRITEHLEEKALNTKKFNNVKESVAEALNQNSITQPEISDEILEKYKPIAIDLIDEAAEKSSYLRDVLEGKTTIQNEVFSNLKDYLYASKKERNEFSFRSGELIILTPIDKAYLNQNSFFIKPVQEQIIGDISETLYGFARTTKSNIVQKGSFPLVFAGSFAASLGGPLATVSTFTLGSIFSTAYIVKSGIQDKEIREMNNQVRIGNDLDSLIKRYTKKN
jgi:hypothetical protein